MQQGWGTLTEERKQEEEGVVWSQPGQRIVCLPPPHPHKFTFKHSISTQGPLLLKAMQKHTVLLCFPVPGAGIRRKNETVEQKPPLQEIHLFYWQQLQMFFFFVISFSHRVQLWE